MKYLYIALFGVLAGCDTMPTVDQCADRPVYRPYIIVMPDRPTLNTNQTISTPGEVVRSVELDLSTLAEYAEKLENLLLAIPSNIGVPE